jgi:hypothetical protein
MEITSAPRFPFLTLIFPKQTGMNGGQKKVEIY